MSIEAKKEIELEIGHVLFIDIVGYSKLLINEQSEVLHELNDLVRETEQVRAADAAGKLIRLPAGDGMALVFRDRPEGPAECALEIAQALKSHPTVQVRMGIHSGPVNEIVDVNERSNIAGAGINVAQRVRIAATLVTFFSRSAGRTTSRNTAIGSRSCTTSANAR